MNEISSTTLTQTIKMPPSHIIATEEARRALMEWGIPPDILVPGQMTLFKLASPDTRINLLKEWRLTYYRLRLNFYAEDRSWDELVDKQGAFAFYASKYPLEKREFGDTAGALDELRREKSVIDGIKERERVERVAREDQAIATDGKVATEGQAIATDGEDSNDKREGFKGPDPSMDVEVEVESQEVPAEDEFDWHDYLEDWVLAD